MGSAFSTIRDFALLTVGFLGGWYLCEKQHRQQVTFQGLGKKLDSAISDLDRELRGQQESSFQQSLNALTASLTRPFGALFDEVGGWFNRSGMPSGEFTR